ncbi:WD40 repeat-like protein [Basidiobolus meristosporus CBS 931.73]|uniref:WD40 repeat-like protein n=1 Tax=Basidiobolus meristosporus CBS 931.73 TaxID=1314790 RepID=A0A1Y1YXN0_9FUNG|nr:WD40 repeat-like protein [Basidiobolus meristosporus CBS 931.73]|eukprot:ORY02781.1 WD40 repeat-like protein [Basidiobolus meristosporus CBS 931.73]
MSDNNSAAPPFGCSFNNLETNGRLLAVADEEGRVNILDTSLDSSIENESARVSWQAHNNAVFDVQWTHDDKRVITVSGDQTAGLWDVETRKSIGKFCGHKSSVKSATIYPYDNHIFATASRDGSIMIWDTRCSGSLSNNGEYRHRPADIIKHAHSLNLVPPSPKRRKTGTNTTGDVSHSVTAVQFLTHSPTLLSSAGAADGLVKIWDTRKHGSHSLKPYTLPIATSLHKGPAKRAHGISSLALDPSGNRLFAASTNNQISMYSTTSLGSPMLTFSAPTYKCSTFYVKIALSPDAKFLASGSSDKNLYVWEIDSPTKPPLILKAHENEVTSVAWYKNAIEHLASCSDDRTVRLWNINRSLAEESRASERLASVNGLAHDE